MFGRLGWRVNRELFRSFGGCAQAANSDGKQSNEQSGAGFHGSEVVELWPIHILASSNVVIDPHRQPRLETNQTEWLCRLRYAAKPNTAIRNVPKANRERAFINAAKTEAMNQAVRPAGKSVRP